MRLAKVATHSDDPTWSRDLELEVGVVWDGHELGIAWPAQYHMICIREVCYLEGEYLCAEISMTPKRDRRSTYPRVMA